MSQYSEVFSTLRTPQTQPIPGSAQVSNEGGGFSWEVDDWTLLERFLTLGSEEPNVVVPKDEKEERAVNIKMRTIENAQGCLRCVQADGIRVVNKVVEVSEAGQAPKNDPAIFVLAIAAGLGNLETRQAAFGALPLVARTGTHLFSFVEDVQKFRGWGRALKNAVARWYTGRSADRAAYQAVKYQQRGGYSHRDLLRQAHPVGPTPEHQALFHWITRKEVQENVPMIVRAFTKAQQTDNVADIVRLIAEYPKLTWEMIPTELLGDAKVWEALLPNLPMTALIRNLGRMSANGLLVPMSQAVRTVVEHLSNVDRLRQERVHPLAVLNALRTYQSGHGVKGSLTWNPVSQVVDALDKAFYLCFGNVEPVGKPMELCLDVSDSMTWNDVAGMPGINPRVASAAMALITANVEPQARIMAFCDSLVPVDISPRQRLDDVIRTIKGLRMGATDCSLPMTDALRAQRKVDTFVVYTDSVTNTGGIHPSQALQEYRRKMGIPAKLVVVAMEANRFTIADPNDSGMLDVVGFNTATPSLISGFARR